MELWRSTLWTPNTENVDERILAKPPRKSAAWLEFILIYFTPFQFNSKTCGHFVPYHFRVQVLSILRMVDSHKCFCTDSFAVIPLAHLWLSCTKILWAVSSRTSCNLEKQLTVVLVNNKQSSKKQHWHQTIIVHYIKLQVPDTNF